MLRNMILISLSAFTLAACLTTTTPEEHKAITNAYPESTPCYEKARSDRHLRMCLRDLLDEAEENMEDMNSELIVKARRNHSEEFEKRAAIKNIADSNLAFTASRDAECAKQAFISETQRVKEDVLMACELHLTHKHLQQLATLQ